MLNAKTLTEIAKGLGHVTHIGISNAYRRLLKRAGTDVKLKTEIEMLLMIANSSALEGPRRDLTLLLSCFGHWCNKDLFLLINRNL